MLDRRSGTIATFDAHAGLGTVTERDGSSYLFHCTTLSDGSRQIDQGVDVTFHVAPGGPGRWEAFDLTPLPST